MWWFTDARAATIVAALLIAALVVTEYEYYRTVDTRFAYDVDTAYTELLNVTMDVTVAMACECGYRCLVCMCVCALFVRVSARALRLIMGWTQMLV